MKSLLFGLLFVFAPFFGHADDIKSYEAKIQFPSQDVDKVRKAFQLGKEQPRTIYFLDTEKHQLFDNGLIIRLRQNDGGKYEVLVKVRPLDANAVAHYQELAPSSKFKWEYGNGQSILEGKVQTKMKEKDVKKILSGKDVGSDLLSADQCEVLLDKAPLLTRGQMLPVFIYGPVQGSFWENDDGDELEQWVLPDGEVIAELSHAGKGDDHEAQTARMEKVLSDIGVTETHDVLKARRTIESLTANRNIVRGINLHLFKN